MGAPEAWVPLLWFIHSFFIHSVQFILWVALTKVSLVSTLCYTLYTWKWTELAYEQSWPLRKKMYLCDVLWSNTFNTYETVTLRALFFHILKSSTVCYCWNNNSMFGVTESKSTSERFSSYLWLFYVNSELKWYDSILHVSRTSGVTVIGDEGTICK